MAIIDSNYILANFSKEEILEILQKKEALKEAVKAVVKNLVRMKKEAINDMEYYCTESEVIGYKEEPMTNEEGKILFIDPFMSSKYYKVKSTFEGLKEKYGERLNDIELEAAHEEIINKTRIEPENLEGYNRDKYNENKTIIEVINQIFAMDIIRENMEKESNE